jgi:aspartyl-tRNA(Asn)/glutamyl-tRNA(Gln) amidotransferase subunit A
MDTPSLIESAEHLRKGALSPVELTKHCLARIEKLNPVLNAFIMVTADAALEQAREAEEEIHRGHWRGPLHGIPLGLKDLIDTAGVRTTAASAVYKDRVPDHDAEITRRLKAAGAVLLGKHNMHEFAYGGSSVIGYYGPSHNPWDTERITGGSSGGSAAAVSAGLCYGAIGSDTSGSIREPASFCSIVGLKPTHGRVSVRGVIPLSVSLDHLGPMARSVGDAAAILQVIAGYDARDPYSADHPVPDYLAALTRELKPFRAGIPRKEYFEDLDPDVASKMDCALSMLEHLGGELREIEVPETTDRTLQFAEAYQYHAEMAARSPELYHPETLRRIKLGANITAEETAVKRRELAATRQAIAEMFETVDVLVLPTTPVPAPPIADLARDPEGLRPRELFLLRNTRPFNVWGLPAISVPCGFTSSGLPIGLQIAAGAWQEERVLRVAHAYEQATKWHKQEAAVNERS